MGFEVEMKFRAADREELTRRLLGLGATEVGPVEQEDAYLAHPLRDFARTNEAFRLRRDGATNRVTYKGPKAAGPTKTREEIEVAFADGPEARADLARLLDRLGFAAVATVRKARRTFHLLRDGRPMEVVLDDVEGLGPFAEVEALAGADDLAEAQAAVLSLADELGLSDVEPRSYLRMLLERGPTAPLKPGGQA